MTTLRQAVQEYVQMRRDLGFKLREAGKALLDFARFMEQHRASYITRRWRSPGRNSRHMFNPRIGRSA